MTELRDLRRSLHREHSATIKQLHHLSPWHNLRLLGFAASWLLGVGLCVFTMDHPWGWLAWPLIWSLCTFGLYAPALFMHDGAHHLLSRNSEVNAWLSFVSGAGAGISAAAYRVNHHDHHAKTGTDSDSGDVVTHANRTGWATRDLIRMFLVFGTPMVIVGVAHGAWRKAKGADRWRVGLEYTLIVAGFAAFIDLAPTEVFLHGWLIPFVWGGFINNVRSLAEHSYTEREDSLRHSRTVIGPWWVGVLHSNANLHWEHHLFPQVPWYHLPALHRLATPHRESLGVPTETSYLRWFAREVWPKVRPGI